MKTRIISSFAMRHNHFSGMTKMVAAAAMLSLAACSGTIVTPTTQGDATACGVALAETLIVDRTQLLNTALSTPACANLAMDALQAIIARTSQQNAARRAAMPLRAVR